MAQSTPSIGPILREILRAELRDAIRGLGLLNPSPAPGDASPAASPAPPTGEDGSGAPLPPGGAPEVPAHICQRGASLRECWACGRDQPWYDDPREIAALWRWLERRELHTTVNNVDYFIENAHEWAEDRERMVREQGRVTDQ